jgi:photosystem II stability/assembly factor-like uncharacterized protein
MSTEPIVYAGTVGEGVWRSTDGGATWQRRSQGMFVECDVRALVTQRDNPRIMFAGTNEGCYRSEDGGEHWMRLDGPLNELVTWSLLVPPDQGNTMFAGTRPAAIYRSADGGQTWQLLDAPLVKECPAGIRFNRVTTLRSDPEDARCIWAGVEIDGVWCSRDGGQSWNRLGEGLSSPDIHGLVIVPGSAGQRKVLACTNNDLNVSTDEGLHWRPQNVRETFPHAYCRGIVQRADRPDVIFLGNGDGPPGSTGAILRSTDAGRSWQRLDLPVTPNSTIWDFAVHPADPQRIYAYSVSGEVYLSTDGGELWSKLPREFGELRALLWVPGG